jgi:uncharacterized protein
MYNQKYIQKEDNMVTGVAHIDFILHESMNLKDKRSVVKKIIDRSRNRFNAAISEVDHLDLYQRGKIGVAVISNNRRHANSMLDNIVNFIEGMHIIDIINIQIELF